MNTVKWLVVTGTKQQKRVVLFMLWAFFAASRIVYYSSGVRFADSWIREDCMSIVPFDLMQTDLIASVWNFHAQPPLFSLFCGSVVNLSGGSEAIAFHLIFLVAGCLLIAGLYTLMLSLGVTFRIAAILTFFFSVSPATILYENLILYTYPVTMMLVLSGLTLYHYVKTADWRWGLGTCALWAIIVLTRSLFHLAWFVTGVAIIFMLVPRLRKRTVLLSLVPFLLVFGWYAKNHVAFGQFASSSWMGMNIARITVNVLTPEEKADLAREGKVSELVFLRPFPGFWQFPGNIDLPHADSTGVAILDMEYADTGFSNYNNTVYLSLSKQFLKDSVAVISNCPGIYITRGLKRSFSLFFAPSNAWFGLWRQNRDYDRNYYAIESFTHVWNAVFYGDFSEDAGNIGWFSLAVYVVVVGYWLYRVAKELRGMREHAAYASVILFMLMTILYITIAGNLFELGENMRFRYNIEPFLLILAGLFMTDMLRRIQARAPKQAVAAQKQGRSRRQGNHKKKKG